MRFEPKDHTFVICAYKESEYLEECMASLKGQTVASRVIAVTSTPNPHISAACEKNAIPLFVNTGTAGIGGDWNFAVRCCETPLFTIAHQDDIYEPGYTETMLRDMNAVSDPLIWFCGYAELRNGKKVTDNRLLKIKRVMLTPLRCGLFRHSRFVRRRILSLGCPICCPAVTYAADKLEADPFSVSLRSDLDWDRWERSSRQKGAFFYRARPLMCHRIHTGSATTEIIGENRRTGEDLEIFRRFWPEPIARRIAAIYAGSEKSNNMETGSGSPEKQEEA